MKLPFFNKRNNQSQIGLFLMNDDDVFCIPGYTSLDHCPEVMTAVSRIAELVGSMTIHLMANKERVEMSVS